MILSGCTPPEIKVDFFVPVFYIAFMYKVWRRPVLIDCPPPKKISPEFMEFIFTIIVVDVALGIFLFFVLLL
jgi:hypothetical protein